MATSSNSTTKALSHLIFGEGIAPLASQVIGSRHESHQAEGVPVQHAVKRQAGRQGKVRETDRRPQARQVRETAQQGGRQDERIGQKIAFVAVRHEAGQPEGHTG